MQPEHFDNLSHFVPGPVPTLTPIPSIAITRKGHELSCGHKLATTSDGPRHSNCDTCWFFFFTIYKDLALQAYEVLQKEGEAGLTHTTGKRFSRNLVRFITTLAAQSVPTQDAPATQEQA